MAKNQGIKAAALKSLNNIIANIKENLAYIQELFWVLSAALIIFVIMEIIKPRIVLGYLNLNFILVLWLLSAIILVLCLPPRQAK